MRRNLSTVVVFVWLLGLTILGCSERAQEWTWAQVARACPPIGGPEPAG